jgi:phosphomevalonate kinase
VIASAPGKLILAGEYAVLRGALCVVAAVDRRARAAPSITRQPSPFLDAAADALRAAGLGDAAAAVATLGIDTSTFRDASGAKLGLGSSAAATVSAVAGALAVIGSPLDRELIHNLARTAHAAAQGLGSGADIVASTYGGIQLLRIGQTLEVRPTRYHVPGGSYLVGPTCFWTGRSADTVTLVRAVEAAGVRATREAIGAIGEASEALAGALSEAEVIAAIAQGADGMEMLEKVVGVELVPANVKKGRKIARKWGGEMKTTGAGGGDVAIAVFPHGAAMREIVKEMAVVGLVRLDLAFDPRGVDIDAGGDYLP